MSKNILIRCDASQSIGLGHITRCLVLANEFKKSGDNIFFAIKNNELAIEKIKEQQFYFIIANDDNFDYFNWIEKILSEKKIDIFIGDIRDGFPIELITFMKNKNILTVAIDEPSDYAKECDICFYPPHAKIDKTKYKGEIYQGLEYIILRPEFYEKFEKKKNKMPNILVMMGGTDTYNLTLPVVKKIDTFKEDFDLSVILYEKHKDIDLLKEFLKISNHKVIVYNKVENMAYFLNNIDFAISQFGTIVYELIIKNITSVVFLNKKNKIVGKYFNNYPIEIINNLEELNINKFYNNKFIINQRILDIKKNTILEKINLFDSRKGEK